MKPEVGLTAEVLRLLQRRAELVVLEHRGQGVGGVLPVLAREVHAGEAELAEAEELLALVGLEQLGDGVDEVALGTAGQTVVVDLAEGAGIGSWDLRASRVAAV